MDMRFPQRTSGTRVRRRTDAMRHMTADMDAFSLSCA